MAHIPLIFRIEHIPSSPEQGPSNSPITHPIMDSPLPLHLLYHPDPIPLPPTINFQKKLMDLHLPHLSHRRTVGVTDGGEFLSNLSRVVAPFPSSTHLVLTPPLENCFITALPMSEECTSLRLCCPNYCSRVRIFRPRDT